MGCFAKNHTGFYRIRAKRWDLCISESFAKGTALKAGSEIVDGMRGPFKPVQCSRFARVSEWTAGFGGTNHNLFIKQYLYRSVWDFVKHLLRPSRAMRAFKASIMLAENALLSPEVVALGQRKYGPFCIASFLITRKIENARGVYTCLPEKGQMQKTGSMHNKRQMIKQLGTTIGRMHRAGIFHGDMRGGNVLAERSEGQWRFFFLDNERTRKFRRLPERLRTKNLVQINMLIEPAVTRTERLRFFKVYLAETGDTGDRAEKLIAEVMAKTAERLKHKIVGGKL